MSSFGVVVCLTLFLSSAYLAPVTNSTESKNEKLKRQEVDKYEDYSKDFDTILKKLFIYINTHLSDTSRATDTKCETINEYEDHFMFHKLKGKIFPKRKPVYVAAIQPSVGMKKYFEISAENSVRYSLKFNESHISFNKLKDEKRPVIEDHNKKAESKNTNQHRKAYTLATRSHFLNNNTVAKIAPTEVTKTSQNQNIKHNLTHFVYAREFDQNISPSLQSTFGNTFYNYIIKNVTKNIINNLTILHDPVTLVIQPSFPTLSQRGFDSNFDIPGIQVYENVTESKNVLYSLEKNRSLWNTAEPTKYVSPLTTSDDYYSSVPKNRSETDNVTKYLPTTENYDLHLTTNSYSTSFEGINENKKIVDIKNNSRINGITTLSLTDFIEQKLNTKHFTSQSDSTSPTIPHDLTVPHSVKGSSDQMSNMSYELLKKQSINFTSVLSGNETLNKFNICTKTTKNFSPSIKHDANSGPSEDDTLSTPLDAIETIKPLNEKDIPILNYSEMTNGQLTLGESTLALSNSSISPHQTSSIFEDSSTTHKDQYNAINNRTEPSHIQNYKSEPTINPYYISSPVDETKTLEYLTSGIETIAISDDNNSLIREYSQLFPGSSQNLNQDELVDSATSPSLDNFSNQMFYPDLYTFSSLVNNTASSPTEFEALNHSDRFSNKSKFEISDFDLKFKNDISLSYPSIAENTSLATKPHHGQESTYSDKHMNKTFEKEKTYSISFSTVSLFHTNHKLNEYQPIDIKIYSPESKTTQNSPEANETTIHFSSDYTNNAEKTTEKENTFVTGSLAKWTQGYTFDKSSVTLTTDNDLLTDKPDENSTLHDSDKIEASATTSYETNTKNVQKLTSTFIVSVKNNSFNYFALPIETSTVRHSGLNVSISDYSSQPGAFNYKIIDNHAVNTDEESTTSGSALLVYDTISPTNTDWNDSSETQPVNSSSHNTFKTKGFTVTSSNFFHEALHFNRNSSQNSFNNLIKNKTEKLIKANLNGHYYSDDSVIENSPTSITENNEDEIGKNIIDPSNTAEKLITNNQYASETIDTNKTLSILQTASLSQKVLLTTPLFVSTKGYVDNSIIEEATTETNTMNPITENIKDDRIVTRKNATRNTSITIDDTGIRVLDDHSSTLFEINVNTYETKGFNPEWSPSVSTTVKPYNLTVEGYSEFTGTEIQDNYTSENMRLMENTTQSYAHSSTYSKESDSFIIQDNSTSNNLTTLPSIATTKSVNFTYTAKNESIINITKNNSTTPSENSEDIFKTTQNSIIPISISMTYNEKNGMTSMLKTTTKHEITSSEKRHEISSTSENKINIEMSTQHYETMPSFNNFTFLLPTTDYLTSYLPVRIHPFIVFSEI